MDIKKLSKEILRLQKIDIKNLSKEEILRLLEKWFDLKLFVNGKEPEEYPDVIYDIFKISYHTPDYKDFLAVIGKVMLQVDAEWHGDILDLASKYSAKFNKAQI